MSLAPARIVSLRSASEPAVSLALSRNFSKVLRACSKLASAIERISLGISKRTFSLILLLRVPPFAHATPPMLHRDDAACSPKRGLPVVICNTPTREPHCGSAACETNLAQLRLSLLMRQQLCPTNGPAKCAGRY